MKANDIQIGDWLYSIIDRYDHIEKKLCKVTGIRTDCDIPLIQCNDTDVWYSLDSYESVPLTKEILEKNGFVKGYMFNNVWNYIEDYKRLVIVYTGEAFNIQDTLIEFKHVHKLQHILKICGIEKEIIL